MKLTSLLLLFLLPACFARRARDDFREEIKLRGSDDVFNRSLTIRREADRLKMESVQNDTRIELDVDCRKSDSLKFEYNATVGNLSKAYELKLQGVVTDDVFTPFGSAHFDSLTCTQGAVYYCNVSYHGGVFVVMFVFSNNTFLYEGDTVYSTDIKMIFYLSGNMTTPKLVGRIESEDGNLEDDPFYDDNYYIETNSLSYLSFEDSCTNGTAVFPVEFNATNGNFNLTFLTNSSQITYDPVMGASSELTGVLPSNTTGDGSDSDDRDWVIAIAVVATLAVIIFLLILACSGCLRRHCC